MSITRRTFLKGGAMAVVGTAAIPSFLTRAAWGASKPGSNKAAGRHLPARRGRRPEHRRSARRARVLRDAAQHQHSTAAGDRSQRLLRAASRAGAFKPLWDQRHLAIVHAAGSPDTTRSHFDAQDYMESGTPGVKEHGRWLAESHTAIGAGQRKARFARSRSALRCRAFFPAKRRRSRSATSTDSASPAAIPPPLPWVIPSKPCTRSPWTACCTARDAKPSKR